MTKNKVLIVVAAVIVLMFASVSIYLSDYYHADMDAINSFMTENPVEVRKDQNGNLIFEPELESASTGLIFYPGGKVEHTAYIPLMKYLASEGVFCVLVEMPFRLAVLDMDAAERIKEQYPEIENWYIGGHSLGGSMAASYLEDHANQYEGLLLLGSYSTADLSQTDLSVLSVYGSEDRVLNRENYESNKTNLPEGFSEVVLEGGCHAYFGMYGAQDGDGVPTITQEEQIALTVDAFLTADGWPDADEDHK